jgi:large subunit ribosomal protein L13
MTSQMTSMKTFSPRPRDIERRWYVVDADGAVLGRLASEVAKILRGKHKPIFAPHADTGDHVIVVNAKGVRLTGAKETSKVHHHHSGFPGGLRSVGFDRLLAERPAVVVERAVKGMLPKNRLGRQMLTKLAVYAGPDHPHRAQKPVALALGEIPAWDGLPVRAPAPEPKAEPKEPRTAARKPASKTGPAKAATRRGTGSRTAAKETKPSARRPASSARSRGSAKPAATKGDPKPARRSRTKPSEES